MPAVSGEHIEVIFVDDDPGIVRLYERGLNKFCKSRAAISLMTILTDAATALDYSRTRGQAAVTVWIIDSMMPGLPLQEGQIDDGLYTGVALINELTRTFRETTAGNIHAAHSNATDGASSCGTYFIVLTHLRASDVSARLADKSISVYEKDKYSPRRFAGVIDAIIEGICPNSAGELR